MNGLLTGDCNTPRRHHHLPTIAASGLPERWPICLPGKWRDLAREYSIYGLVHMDMSQLKKELWTVLVLSFLSTGGCKIVPTKELPYNLLFHSKTLESPASFLGFNHDGSRLLSAPQHNTVSLLRSESGEVINRYEFQDLIAGLEFLDTGEIFIAKYAGTIELWDAGLSQSIKSHEFSIKRRNATIHQEGRWGFYGDRFFSWGDSIDLELDLSLIDERRLDFLGSEYAVAIGLHDGSVVTIDLDNMSRSE